MSDPRILGTAAVGAPQFPGLSALRALAALFVVIGHIPLNQAAVKIPSPSWGAFFFRGQPAVLFFFTLSGFLITYLLLAEERTTGTISVRNFYIRRALRIWPLYFSVVAFGLVFYNLILPRLGIDREHGYSIGLAVLLYSLFLPNLMNALYSMGGILNPLWSIGIEEQFYLFWAPVVRRWRSRLPWVCGGLLVIFLLLFVFNSYDVFGAARAKLFVGQIKFHFMAGGALCAWWLHQHGARLFETWPFRRLGQIAAFALLAEFYLVGRLPWGGVGSEIAQLVLYSWLVLNTAANPAALIRFDSPVLNTLGGISYGMYMLHMPVVYATSAFFAKTSWWHGQTAAYLVAYYVAAIGGTIVLAAASYRFLEKPFLRLKQARFSPPAVET